jgi:phage protein D/phage baseplate assembly protein gpV
MNDTSERYPTDAIPDRPEIGLSVDGQALERSFLRDVMEVDIHEEINRHARLSLLVQNWDPDNRQVHYSDDGPYLPGKAIAVSIGYHAELTQVFSGVITAIEAHFSSVSGVTLQVEARSKSILLAGPARSRLFEETSDGDVAQAIAADYNLSAKVESGPSRQTVVHDRRSDWEALTQRAEAIGWVAYVRDDDLVFRPPAKPNGEVPELTWGMNLTEIHLTEDLTRLADPVKAVAWDPEQLASADADADASDSEVDDGGRATATDALGDAGWPSRTALIDVPLPQTSDELDRLAVGRVNRQELEHVHGYGTTLGVPVLRIDSWLKLIGVGDRLGGTHYLTAVRHRIGPNGFRTEFRLGLAAPLVPPANGDSADRSAIHLGVVDDLDDPLGWGRVKVKFPWRSDATDAVWARIATLDAGPDEGTWFIPDVGQEVAVGFVDGDEAQPLVLGSLWNGQQGVPFTIDPDKNDIRAIKSRSGHVVKFDDGEEKTVTIETADKRTIVLDDNGKKITVEESGSKNKVELSDSGITLTAAKGDITLKASSGKVKIDASGIDAKTTGPAKIESSATAELKASATLTLSGALVKLN